MKKLIFVHFIVLALISGCSNLQQPPKIESVTTKGGRGVPFGRSDSDGPYFKTLPLTQSQDPEYGKTAQKPIKTAPRHVKGHIWFLNSLRGPTGQPVEYERRGACCHFEDKSLDLGGGMLDVYEIKIDGSTDIKQFYVDMYHKGPPEIPVGFSQRKDQ